MRHQTRGGNHKPSSSNFQVAKKPGQHWTAVLSVVLEIVPKKVGCQAPSSQAAKSLNARPRVSHPTNHSCYPGEIDNPSSRSQGPGIPAYYPSVSTRRPGIWLVGPRRSVAAITSFGVLLVGKQLLKPIGLVTSLSKIATSVLRIGTIS